MGLINDIDKTGSSTVRLTKITSNARYIDPAHAMSVWPPLVSDGSTPYGQPYVHLFFVDSNNHAQWYRMNPAVSQHTWTQVQDFGFMTGILIYRGIVTMWNSLFSRSYNFYGGSELVFPDGSGGPTSSGAPAGGNNLMSNQPFHAAGESYFAAYNVETVGSNAGYTPGISRAFCSYLFAYYDTNSNNGVRPIITPPGQFIPGNPTGVAPAAQVDDFLTPQDYDGKPTIAAVLSTAFAVDDSMIHGRIPCLIGAPEVVFDPPSPIPGSPSPPPRLVANQKVLTPQLQTSAGPVQDSFFPVNYGMQQGANFQTFTDFGGASGGSGSNSYVGLFSGANIGGFQTRGSFHPGYTPSGDYAVSKGLPIPWDKGLLSPETCVTTSLYNNVVFVQGLDHAGLLASNFAGSTVSKGFEIQNDGSRTNFGKCRILGSPDVTNVVSSFAPPIMPLSDEYASFGFWTSATSGTGEIYWLTDSEPLVHDAFARIVPLADAPQDPPLVYTYDDIPLPPTVSPLGVASSNNTLPHFDLQQLTTAAANPSVMPNPNNSSGVSPVLRAIFEMSGLPFSVTREILNDNGAHQAGNAIDIAGPTPPLTGDGLALDDVSDQEIVDLSTFIKSVPELFDAAVRVNVDNDTESLYVLNGKIADKNSFSASLRNDSQRAIHVASSGPRLLSALKDPGVQAALGVGPAQETLVNGTLVIRRAFQLGQFGARYVYVNQDQLLSAGKGVKGLAVSKDNPKIVHFW